MHYPNLFQAFSLKGIQIKSRIVLAPMYTGWYQEDGVPSEWMIELYAKRARALVGLSVVECAAVNESAKGSRYMLRTDQDRFIPELARLARAIEKNESVPILQLYHAGRYGLGERPKAPSAEPFFRSKVGYITPEALTEKEIEGIVQEFAMGAKRAIDAGFAGIEVHGATGYLIVQFLSPRMNKRLDAYGGPLENRARFYLEVVRSIRDAIGKDPVLGCRFMPDEWADGGFGLGEAKTLAKWLEACGVDYLSCNAGTYESWSRTEIKRIIAKPGYQVDVVHEVKKAVNLPVFTNGRFVSPDLAESVLDEGKADAVALARPLFADPEYAIKAFEGRQGDIVTCKGDGLCTRQVQQGKWAVCSQWKEPPWGLRSKR
jgi:2,4-dienoyl-CoA reductase-like NADH-dependent reductase (Old Yellow Enzyme family)